VTHGFKLVQLRVGFVRRFVGASLLSAMSFIYQVFFWNKREKRKESKGKAKCDKGRKSKGECACLGEDFLEARVHAFLVQFVAVERQALNEFLRRALRLERKQRQAERDVAPLPRVFGQAEALAELFDDALRLLFLFHYYMFAPSADGSGARRNGSGCHLFDECEDVAHRALKSFFVHRVFAD